MKYLGLAAISLFAVTACSDVTYIDNRLAAKLMFNGQTYDVYEAVQVDEAGGSTAGGVYETRRTVFRLFPEGVDPQIDATTTGMMFGANREMDVCSGSLEACRERFLLTLSERARQLQEQILTEGDDY
ncbi:hypothetical protein FHS89_000087 [Rubricella aquisinus]|uniref:Lipoprotein n=1 Tax=Rubricella aquisinus TaxID=2028108 RepID=A0A840WG09_9RHOB|nr:hypothetical protein [Rubricella aquisinus]MBB5514089.1 hypothetical protein [Rubricella aquisinus]